jgi:hypothetical protein
MKTTSISNDPAKTETYSYVLRLWRAEAPDPGWRASLEDQSGSGRMGFASLEQLFAYLMELVEGDAKGARSN